MNLSPRFPADQLSRLIEILFVRQNLQEAEILLQNQIRWCFLQPGVFVEGRDAAIRQMQQFYQGHPLFFHHSPIIATPLSSQQIVLSCELWMTPDQTREISCWSLIAVMDRPSRQFSCVHITIHSPLIGSPRQELAFICAQQDESLTLCQVNEPFLQLIGMSRDELNDRGGNLIQLTDARDTQQLILEIQKLSEGHPREFQIRLLPHDGKPVWVLVQAFLPVQNSASSLFCCTMVNITASRQNEEELRLSLHNYQQLITQGQDILFEWDIVHDRWSFSELFHKRLGYAPLNQAVPDELVKNHRITQDSAETLRRLLQKIRQGALLAEDELKLLDADNNPVWFRMRVAAQLSEQGQPLRAVGVLADIDEEKKTSQRWIEKASMDALTRFYNKETTQSLIELWLKENPKAECALMIVDIDDFKQVNDSLGHLYGDAFLVEIASRIRRHFRRDDILGRVGGDEFVIFMKNTASQDLIQRKTAQVLEAFRTLETQSEKLPSVSCSIGVAINPKGNTAYSPLFEKADLALYSAKSQGKNRMVLYSSVTDIEKLGIHYSPSNSAVSAPIESCQNLAQNLRLITYAFQTLYRGTQAEEAIMTVLELLGRQLDVCRVYVFENSEDNASCSNTYEWCAPGIAPQKDQLQDLKWLWDPQRDYQRYFNDQGIFYCRSTDDLHDDLGRFLTRLGIQSVLQCAILDRGEFRGFIGFDECREKRFWDQGEIDLLQLIAGLVSVFLLKQRAEEKRRG